VSSGSLAAQNHPVTRKQEDLGILQLFAVSMKSQCFWDDEFAKIHDIDSALLAGLVG
jgi:hypothetical protein